MIAVIDYGASNLRSVVNALEAIGQKPTITNNPEDLADAVALVLPGVGAFGKGMDKLRELEIIDALTEEVKDKKKPFLGICVGLQFLAKEGFEHGKHKGLGWIDGAICRLEPNDPKFRIPHIGWNDLQIKRTSKLFEGFDKNPIVYFVHSYHLVVEAKDQNLVTTTCWHGQEVTASIEQDNIHAVQFHPEKSQECGIKVLENFVGLIE